jgi:hypothetical protein
LALGAQRIGQIVVGLAIGRLEGYGAIEGGRRLGQPLQTVKRDAEIVMGLGRVGLQGDGLVLGRHRLVQAPQVLERHAQVAVSVGEAGAQGNGLGDQVGGAPGVTLLALDDAEKMQGIDAIGRGSQDVTVEPLGLGKLPGLMMGQSIGEHPIRWRRAALTSVHMGSPRQPVSRGHDRRSMVNAVSRPRAPAKR